MKDPRIGRIGMRRYPQLLSLIAKGKNASEIADLLNVNPETVRKFCRKRNIVLERVDMSMENHPCWKGGTILDRTGYVLQRVDKHGPHGYLIRAIQKRGKYGTDQAGYAPVHRIVMHNQLGRNLKRGEVVDHIDGDLKNNDPSNLRVFASNAEHLRETLKGKCPNWTPEGRSNMKGRPADPSSANQMRLAMRSQSKNDGQV
jgi:hypothetical protein